MINGSSKALSGPEPTSKLNGVYWKNTLKTVPIWKYAKTHKIALFCRSDSSYKFDRIENN